MRDIIINRPDTCYIHGGFYPAQSKWVKEHFWEIAKARTLFLSTPEYVAYRTKTVGVVSHNYREENATVITWTGYDYNNEFVLKGMEIAINEGSYISGSKDLIKYAHEHEICEAWLILNRNGRYPDFDVPHLVARKHEFRCAVADGNGLRLLKYLKLCVSNNPPEHRIPQEEEFQYAYDLAFKRNPIPQLTDIWI